MWVFDAITVQRTVCSGGEHRDEEKEIMPGPLEVCWEWESFRGGRMLELPIYVGD